MAWDERPRLLAVARNRTPDEADAQDAVSEAIARALESVDTLDPRRVGAWLTTVTVNLCTDLARDRARQHKRIRFEMLHQAAAPPVEAVVVDRVAAAEVVPLLHRLPAEQRRALALRADGFRVAEIADQMRVTEKAAESLLSRARTSARAIVSAVGAGTAVLVGALRRCSSPTAVMTSAALVLAVAAPWLGLPHKGSASGMPVAPTVHAKHTGTPAGQPSHGSERRTVAPARRTPAHAEVALRPRQGQPVRPPVAVDLGPVAVRNDGSDRQRPDETFVQSIQHCVADGVEISTHYAGCTDAKDQGRS